MPELQLLRPVNCCITGLSVVVGALSGGFDPFSGPVLLAVMAAALITGAGNAYNDMCDVEIDRINQPHRPLPAGRISHARATWISSSAAAGGLLLASLVGAFPGWIAGITLLGLWVYSRALKGTVFWDNLMVAILASFAFPFGALAGGELGRAWIPAGFALLFHLGREIVKDIEDVDGDGSRGVRTLALAFGQRKAAFAATAVYSILIVTTLVPFLLKLYDWGYLVAVILMDLLILCVLIRLLTISTNSKPANSRLLTTLMPLGLLAIIVGELWRP